MPERFSNPVARAIRNSATWAAVQPTVWPAMTSGSSDGGRGGCARACRRLASESSLAASGISSPVACAGTG